MLCAEHGTSLKRWKSAAGVLIANRIANPKVRTVMCELKEGDSEILT